MKQQTPGKNYMELRILRGRNWKTNPYYIPVYCNGSHLGNVWSWNLKLKRHRPYYLIHYVGTDTFFWLNGVTVVKHLAEVGYVDNAMEGRNK